ncbi:CobW family GTP-binding protein [Urbifossiella limnaea]|uniref:Putative GTP-binding protein YjiA n=1 Tax=Urbifossiella limnaea TaxID=2528023 RepID=A0A517XZ33_9BACT|nr:GTP-binding protein [Urbifossiella limnaea]QDU22775.1 putative GTP-binding protein YjiA [Urbifossiella limnaea]
MTVPTNLITGFLGVGKTTAVLDLLARKAAGSRWAVLVNEYGEVGVDGALIDGAAPAGVTVREVGGGCVCCASAPYLGVALHFLLIDAKPDRLLIETTGLGHPARLIDTLRASYRGRLDVRATLGLIDPADFAQPAMRANPIFREQVELADVLVLNKLDAAGPALVAEFQAWANDLDPPKLLVAATERGRIDEAWLDLEADRAPPSRPRQGSEPQAARTAPTPDGAGSGVPHARGWTFPPDVVFDRDRVVALLAAPGLVRAKGVFRTPYEWYAVNRARTSAPTVTPTAYRRDSRVEAFADAPDWAAFERELRAAILPPR